MAGYTEEAPFFPWHRYIARIRSRRQLRNRQAYQRAPPDPGQSSELHEGYFFRVLGPEIAELFESARSPEPESPSGRPWTAMDAMAPFCFMAGAKPASDFRIQPASWEKDGATLTALRTEVFVEEQGVPLEIEIDGLDPRCRHVAATDARDRVMGTARMNAAGHIGRVAVARAWRRRGVGSRLVSALVEAARHAGLRSVDLDSQLSAVAFYESLGFSARGEVFIEAGIDHQNMVLALEPA